MAAIESMEEWIRTLLEEGRCLDCKVALDEGDGTLEFRGPLPHVKCIGRLCLAECFRSFLAPYFSRSG